MIGSSWPRTLAMPLTQALAPGTRVSCGGHAQHFAGFLARDEVQLAGHAERDADPLARAAAFSAAAAAVTARPRRSSSARSSKGRSRRF